MIDDYPCPWCASACHSHCTLAHKALLSLGRGQCLVQLGNVFTVQIKRLICCVTANSLIAFNFCLIHRKHLISTGFCNGGGGEGVVPQYCLISLCQVCVALNISRTLVATYIYIYIQYKWNTIIQFNFQYSFLKVHNL